MPQSDLQGRFFEPCSSQWCLLQAALDLLADLMANSRECLKGGLVLLVRLTFALEPQQDFKWRTQPEAIIRRATQGLACCRLQ